MFLAPPPRVGAQPWPKPSLPDMAPQPTLEDKGMYPPLPIPPQSHSCPSLQNNQFIDLGADFGL